MNTITLTLTLNSNMSSDEAMEWMAQAIETDLSTHLLEGETIEVTEARKMA